MFIIGYFLSALATVLNYALIFYMWVVIARAVLSWVSPDPYNPIVRFIHNVTEPVHCTVYPQCNRTGAVPSAEMASLRAHRYRLFSFSRVVRHHIFAEVSGKQLDGIGS
jgi:hypothetical protein